MNLKELLEKRAELKRQGNQLWERAQKEAAGMEPEDKEKFMEKVRQEDTEIFISLKETDELIERAMRYADDERKEIADQAVREEKRSALSKGSRTEFKSLGELLQAIACAASPIVASTFPPSERESLNRKLALYQAAASGMSTGVPSDGGYLMRSQWTGDMLTRARESSVLMPYCRRVPIGADFDSLEYPYIDETSRADGSRWGGVQVFWAAEAGTVTAKKPKIGKGELRLEEIMGLAYATSRLLRDASALESILTDSFTSEFGFLWDNSAMRGTGAGQMLGILNSPALVSVTRDGSDNLVTIMTAFEAMPARLKSTAVWLHHAAWLTKFIGLKVGDAPIWFPPGSGVGGATVTPVGMLIGRPTIELEQCSAVGTAGDLCFFNLGEYVYIEKQNEGIAFDQSMHVNFLYNEMAFRWVYRTNGQPILKSSVLRYTGSTYMSPFVTVAA